MANSDSPISHAVKEAVNQSTKNGLLLGSLPPTAIKILEVYLVGGTAQQASKQCHCSKQNVSRHTKMLLRRGFIRLQTHDVFKIYSVTPLGQSIFTGSDTTGEASVLEDYAVKFAIIRGETCRVDWKKLGDPNNWVKLGTHVDGLRVERTSQNIIIHPGKMPGFNADKLLFDSGRAVQKCKDILEGQFGMRLSSEGVELHKPIFRFYSEEAKEDVKHGTVTVDGVGAIDNSPPEHIPHEEYFGIDRTRARNLLPDSIKALRSEVYEFKNQHSESIQYLKKEVAVLRTKNEELISVNTELVKANIATVQEVKILSSQVKSLLDALQAVQQKTKGPEVTVATTQNIELNRIYE